MKPSASRNDLPITGLASDSRLFPPRDPDSALKGLKGAECTFCEAELALARCEFSRAKVLAEQLLCDDKYIFVAVRMGFVAAIGLGDLKFFDQVLRSLEDYRKRAPSIRSALGVEIAVSWLRLFLWLPAGHPEWMCRFDLSDIPEPWRASVAYLGVKILIAQGSFESAYAAASLFLNFVCPQQDISIATSYAKMACAVACRETGRTEEMMKWLDEAVRMLVPHGFLLPLFLFMHGSHKSPVEELIAEIAPDSVPRYRDLSKRYFANLIRARNHYTGEHMTTALSFREFYLAMLLKRDMSYKDLSERFEVTVGRMKNIVSAIYDKLGIHSSGELRDLVW